MTKINRTIKNIEYKIIETKFSKIRNEESICKLLFTITFENHSTKIMCEKLNYLAMEFYIDGIMKFYIPSFRYQNVEEQKKRLESICSIYINRKYSIIQLCGYSFEYKEYERVSGRIKDWTIKELSVAKNQLWYLFYSNQNYKETDYERMTINIISYFQNIRRKNKLIQLNSLYKS